MQDWNLILEYKECKVTIKVDVLLEVGTGVEVETVLAVVSVTERVEVA